MAVKMKRNKKTKIVFIALIIFTIYIVVSLVMIGNDIKEKNAQTVELEEQIADKEAMNEELQNLIDNGADAEYIIKMAKDKLGLVFPDERIYMDIISGK